MSKQSEQMDNMTVADIKESPCEFCWGCNWERVGDCYENNPAQCAICAVILKVVAKCEQEFLATPESEE